MARLLFRDEWFECLSSASYYEAEFEALIRDHSELLFPEFIMVPFRTTVSSEFGERKPDFALIDRQYRSWWVVEVELASHPLQHVLDQVAVFATGSYGDSQMNYLCQQSDILDMAFVGQMMKGAPPGVLVVVDAPQPEWNVALKRWSALLALVEVFRSERNQYVLRVNGERPLADEFVLSSCRLDPLLPRLIMLDSPAALLGHDHSGALVIEYEGTATEWDVIEAKDRVWLSPVRTNPLRFGRDFVLVQGPEGRLAFRPS